MREASQSHVVVPFPRFQSVRKHEFVRNFRALVMFVGGVERREETECVDTTEQHGDEERDREKVVIIMVVFLEDSLRRRRRRRLGCDRPRHF